MLLKISTIFTATLLLFNPSPGPIPIVVQSTPTPIASSQNPILPGPGPKPTVVRPTQVFPSIVILSIGDSLTYGKDGSLDASYRLELSRLMNLTGQPHVWKVEAHPGRKCSFFASWLDYWITVHQPNLILLNCGTNDTPTDDTTADYRTLISIAQSHGVPIIGSLISQPDMESDTNIVRPYIYSWMKNTKLAIGQAIDEYNIPYANFVRVPSNIEWLQSDGIHLTARSEAAYAQLFYQAIRPTRGWREITMTCGLSGHWQGEPWPIPDVDYRVCRN